MAKTVSHGIGGTDAQSMIDATHLTNSVIVNHFVNTMRANKRSSQTVSNREWLLRRLGDYLDPTPLTLADFEQLLEWQNSISNLSAGSVAGYVAGVRVFYRWLVRPMRVLEVSPADDLVIPRVPDRKPRPVPERDFQYALAGCVDPMMRVWLELGRYAGLRCCEIAWLTRDHVIDEEPLRLHVVGKGRRERMVFISRELRDSLAPYLTRQGPLFVSILGRAFTPKTISDRVSQYFGSIGLPYTAHQLRHLYGTDGLRRTKNIRVIQDQMGHRSPATTQHYTEVFEPEAVALAAELGADQRKNRRR